MPPFPTLFQEYSRKLQVAFTRISLGNAPTNNIVASLHNTSTQCDHCATTDSTKHRLFSCPHYLSQRIALQQEIGAPDLASLDYSSLLNLQSIPVSIGRTTSPRFSSSSPPQTLNPFSFAPLPPRDHTNQPPEATV